MQVTPNTEARDISRIPLALHLILTLSQKEQLHSWSQHQRWKMRDSCRRCRLCAPFCTFCLCCVLRPTACFLATGRLGIRLILSFTVSSQTSPSNPDMTTPDIVRSPTGLAIWSSGETSARKLPALAGEQPSERRAPAGSDHGNAIAGRPAKKLPNIHHLNSPIACPL